MRYIVSIIIFLCGSLFANAISNPKDSLIRLLHKTLDSDKKVSIYRNLADLYFEEPEETTYLKRTYQEAQKTGKRAIMFDALSDLAVAYIKLDQIDSVKYCIEYMENSGSAKEIEENVTFVRMKLFDALITSKDNEKLLEENLKPLKEKIQNTYQKLEQAYITGSAFYYTEKISISIPYFKTALKLCEAIPDKDRGKFEIFILWQLKQTYRGLDTPKRIALIEELIKKREIYYNKYYKSERPFYNINCRFIQDYASLLSCIGYLPEKKAKLYMKRLLDYSKGSTKPIDKYSVFLAFNNYYLFHEDYEKAIVTNDSLIKYAKIIARYNLPGLYDTEAQIYCMMGKYKEAYENLRLSYTMKDSLMTEKSNEQLGELKVKYDVDKLKHENALLEIKNKRTLIICLFSILFIVIIICIYQYSVLQKEKRMKEELRRLNIKAEESENMKTAFINSICHEIRTPLNAIVGFSELAFDDSIDMELKKTFPEEIQRNTALLTSLISDMLEVSNLDSSKEKLPCESENLNDICIYEMDKLKMNRKENIEYILDFPESNPIISTHRKYLAVILGHLLDNANKFTEQGYISISYRIDKTQKKLLLAVEDTGCGIPLEKCHLVFERFSKLDSFKQGNGLGLYLCQLIVKRLSGNIYIDPEHKQGARFVIQLPI